MSGLTTQTPVAEVDLEVVGRLRLVTSRLARRIRQWSVDESITPSRLSALSTIDRRGPIRLVDLADKERVTKATITRIVSNLEGIGYVKRSSNLGDRRCANVTTTDRGRLFLSKTQARTDAYLVRQFSGLSDEDRIALREAVDVLERLLEVKA
jgi:DNA-binding MarR family transcriptional regulator